ncbi:uncharacterized protein KGF55_002865 [Candida pseudojiufengensis]|uniref:uncharacterized protein n=1 Tax=Candida pseudojiufengensis TaxID=497109 RepID=UPI002225A0FD|nr:uncharacterized protein KGF55_002865 [Candida pseudojiufengensis]KAI5963073.1 hypothetical protein KGF55_002865 [Candida pseudojiufengensis]
MENVYTALCLSLITKNRFVISCEDSTKAIDQFTQYILKPINLINPSQIVIIDLLQSKTDEEILDQMSYDVGDQLWFKNIILWKNLQKLDLIEYKRLYKLILQVDNYNMNSSKLLSNLPSNFTINKRIIQVYKPKLFTIIPFLEYDLFDNKIYNFLKEQFWLSVNFPIISDLNSNIMSKFKIIPNTQDVLLNLRSQMDKVFISPEIKSYIYSLVVFIRCHRIASLSPKSVRISTIAIEYIHNFCKALVLWKKFLSIDEHPHDTTFDEKIEEKITTITSDDDTGVTATSTTDIEMNPDDLFVTPEYVKIAIRKIGYWLVDWEYNTKFANTNDYKFSNNEEQTKILENKKLEISMLTGDWYGTDYYHANDYLKGYKHKKDYDSPTGFTNKIIEDCISSVRPPL